MLVMVTNVTNAKAHFLYHHQHLSLDKKVKYFKRSIHHDETAIKWLDRVEYEVNKHRQKFNKIKQQIQWHRAALRWNRLLLQHYQAKWDALHPQVPAHYYAWLCIHRYEGSWTDSGSPYYGGLQMDWDFMNTYGHSLLVTKGTADHWTPMEQMYVAENAYSSGRGFYPWPNTARACGLI